MLLGEQENRKTQSVSLLRLYLYIVMTVLLPAYCFDLDVALDINA